MNPTASSTGVQSLALVLPETQSQAPTKDGIAGDLLNVSRVNYVPDYSYIPQYTPQYQAPPDSHYTPQHYPTYQNYTPDYSYTPTYTPNYPYIPDGPNYTPQYQSPTPDNANTIHQGYGYSAQRDPNVRPNDLGQPGAEPVDKAPGGLLARMFPSRGNHPPAVSRWMGAVGAGDGKPVMANLSLLVDGTATVGFQISSKGGGPSRFSADEQAYWKALGFQNTLRK